MSASGCLCHGEAAVVIICLPLGKVFHSCFILTCLGNCGNPDELCFPFLRINFLQFTFQKHCCAFCFGYKHSCIFSKYYFSHQTLLSAPECHHLVDGKSENLAKAGTPWMGIKIKSHVVLWHLTSESHKYIHIISFGYSIFVSISTDGRYRKKSLLEFLSWLSG